MIQTVENLRIMLVRSAGFPEQWVNELEVAFPRLNFVVADDNEDSIYSKIPGVDVLIGCPRHIFRERLLQLAGERLQWVHGSGAGVEEFLFPKFIESNIVFTNGRIIQGPEVADHALALLLALTRNINLLLKGKNRGSMPRAIELRKKTCLILGLGGIGMLVAERVRAFGMYTIGISNDLPPMTCSVDEFYEPDRFLEMIPNAHVVICAAPNTERTRHHIGVDHFRAMKNDSIFINVSRGAIVQTEALLQVLKEGRLRGVGLDVTHPEPLPERHPLWDMDNVLITPHMAGPSDQNRRRSFDLIKTNIARFCRGDNLLNVVNKRLGY